MVIKKLCHTKFQSFFITHLQFSKIRHFSGRFAEQAIAIYRILLYKDYCYLAHSVGIVITMSGNVSI